MSLFETETEAIDTVKPSRVGAWTIALGVLLGNVLTGLLAGLLYLAVTH